jgi:hypothetical protein
MHELKALLLTRLVEAERGEVMMASITEAADEALRQSGTA